MFKPVEVLAKTGRADERIKKAMIDIASGHPASDRYLAESYERVRGMSSRFAAAICGHLIQRQTELGIDRIPPPARTC